MGSVAAGIGGAVELEWEVGGEDDEVGAGGDIVGGDDAEAVGRVGDPELGVDEPALRPDPPREVRRARHEPRRRAGESAAVGEGRRR